MTSMNLTDSAVKRMNFTRYLEFNHWTNTNRLLDYYKKYVFMLICFTMGGVNFYDGSTSIWDIENYCRTY